MEFHRVIYNNNRSIDLRNITTIRSDDLRNIQYPRTCDPVFFMPAAHKKPEISDMRNPALFQDGMELIADCLINDVFQRLAV